jgi:hypothetical protein
VSNFLYQGFALVAWQSRLGSCWAGVDQWHQEGADYQEVGFVEQADRLGYSTTLMCLVVADQVSFGQVMADQVSFGQVVADQVSFDQVVADQADFGQVVAGRVGFGRVWAGRVGFGRVWAGQEIR